MASAAKTSVVVGLAVYQQDNYYVVVRFLRGAVQHKLCILKETCVVMRGGMEVCTLGEHSLINLMRIVFAAAEGLHRSLRDREMYVMSIE